MSRGKIALLVMTGLLAGGGAAAAVVVPGSARHTATPPATVPPTQRATITTSSPPPSGTPTHPGPSSRVKLVSYGGCPQVLAGIKSEALAEVGPYGIGEGSSFAPTNSAGMAAGEKSAAPAAAAGATAAPAAPGQAYSTTNDQEAGVDEPDLAKTDGNLLVSIRHDPVGIEVVDVGNGGPRLDAFLAIPSAQELFLTGGDAVVVGQGEPATGVESTPVGGQGGSTTVTVVSLSDPAHPSVVRTFDLQGSETGARLIDGRVVVVLQSEPVLPFVSPTDGTAQSQASATQQNRAVIEKSSLSGWLPSVTVSPGGRTWPVDCGTTLHPDVASGLGTVSVVSLDPNSDNPGSSVTVVGNASTVYASVSSLYVATMSWADQVAPDSSLTSVTTDIHGFDLSDPSKPRYIGSGSVPGTLIGQYAMSEYAGDLRVATTVGSATPPPNEGSLPAELSDNRVTVLAAQSGALVPIGEVGGLGQGEKIYAVRFVGPLGYVVTFRQTDPLYVVNLADPKHPVVAGQVGLTGFSSFLQPLAGSLILGVGQSVDSNLRQSGLQLSVFDVSNPASPALLSRVDNEGAFSSAENDPHALLWWPSQRLVAMPVSSSAFDGVAVWHVGSDGQLHEVARLSQPDNQPQPGPVPQPGGPPTPGPCESCGVAAPAMMVYPGGTERTLVVGGLLYTVSDAGIMATTMSTWTQAAWLAFTGS